jgi:hypothetical protein
MTASIMVASFTCSGSHEVVVAGVPSVDLEPVIQVIMLASGPGPCAGEQVNRDEKPAPPLDLSDVSLFVVPTAVKALNITSDDRMTQRHGRSHDYPPLQKPARKSAVELQRPSTNLNPSARREGQSPRRQADQGRRCGPGVNQEPRRLPPESQSRDSMIT